MIEIVNVNKSWGIGHDGDLLIYIPEDMKFFRERTAGQIVIMGRKTLESFPGKRPLKGRDNIVITSSPEKIEQAELPEGTTLSAVKSIEDAVLLSEKLSKSGTAEKEVFCIGGASVYKAMLPYCDTALVTVNDSTKDADKYYPDLDSDPSWEMVSESEVHEHEGIHYTFRKYQRIHKAADQ